MTIIRVPDKRLIVVKGKKHVITTPAKTKVISVAKQGAQGIQGIPGEATGNIDGGTFN